MSAEGIVNGSGLPVSQADNSTMAGDESGISGFGGVGNYANHGEGAGQSSGLVLTEEEKNYRKIFVGGLSRNTTAESLKQYFTAFGAVHSSEVLFDKLTGRSRGFGFVTFEEISSVNNVVDRHHTVDDSQVEVRRAIPREEARNTQPRKPDSIANDGSGRVFIGGLGDEVTDDVLRGFFSQFGELISANVMVDRETNRPRGFGFVIYKNPEDADKALGVHKDLGPNCEAKRAQPRNQGQRGAPRMPGGQSYRMGGGDNRLGNRGGRMDYDYQMGYGSGGQQGQMYGGYNYAYHPYYAAYYAQMPSTYGGNGNGGCGGANYNSGGGNGNYGGGYGTSGGYSGYGQSPMDPSGGADRGGRMANNRSTPY